jgi:lipopolysaccharide export system protein LptA
MKKWFITSLVLALSSSIALADASDKEKPISVEATSFKANQVDQIATYSGNVVVRQGTLKMTGAKLIITENAKGYRQMELTGKKAQFRQRRDPSTKGIEEWFEAEAQRIVYEEASGIITLYQNAKVARTENGIVKDRAVHEDVITRVLDSAAACGLHCFGLCASPIEGGDGNREYLAGFDGAGGFDRDNIRRIVLAG